MQQLIPAIYDRCYVREFIRVDSKNKIHTCIYERHFCKNCLDVVHYVETIKFGPHSIV